MRGASCGSGAKLILGLIMGSEDVEALMDVEGERMPVGEGETEDSAEDPDVSTECDWACWSECDSADMVLPRSAWRSCASSVCVYLASQREGECGVV